MQIYGMMHKSCSVQNVSIPYEAGQERLEQYFTNVEVPLLLCLICVGGLFGNILSLIVFSRPGHETSMDILLRCLAISDALFLLVTLLLSAIPSLLILGGVGGSTLRTKLLYLSPYFDFSANACKYLFKSVA